MSRKGKEPIPLPKGVEVTVEEDLVSVKGSKGQLSQKISPLVTVVAQENVIEVGVQEGAKDAGKWQGLYRSLIANMVTGVSTGFTRTLELIGVGFRAAVKGKSLELQLGFSHPVVLDIPEGIEVKVAKNVVELAGADKQKLGLFASTIQQQRPPEPYQGKGVRYQGQYVRRKAGKAAGKK